MYYTQSNPEVYILKHEITEMNSKMFLFVNPYEVNPGNSRLQQYVNNCISTTQLSPILVKTPSRDLSTCELHQTSSKKVKVELEEFSNVGELIPSLSGKCVMDEFDLHPVEAEKIDDFTLQSYGSQSSKDFVDLEDSHKCEYHQLYIDNQHINLDDINEDDLHVLQQELSSGCENSDLNVHSNDTLIKNTNLVNQQPSNILQFEVNSSNSNCKDHPYSNDSSPSDTSITTEPSPMEFSNPISYDENIGQFKRQNEDFTFGMKLFVEDTLNTPDILEYVVGLEDERFNFHSCLNDKKPQALNEADLTFEPTQSSQVDEESLIITSEACTKRSRKKKIYGSDEDYVAPKTTRTRKKTIKVIENDKKCDVEYIPITDRNSSEGMSKRISSLSSDSSKDSCRVSKYRESREKNNESSRKSRLKRRVKELEMDTEAQELEERHVKLKTEVQELQRVVDTFRASLFQVMMKR